VIFIDFLSGCWGAVGEVVEISCGATSGEVQGSASASEVNGLSEMFIEPVATRA